MNFRTKIPSKMVSNRILIFGLIFISFFLFEIFVWHVDFCSAQLFRRGERLRSLQRKIKREAKRGESELRDVRDKIRSELSDVVDTNPKEELQPVFDTIKDVVRTPPLPFAQPGRLTLAYMASIQNLEELDAVLGKVAKDVDSEELYYDFRASSQSWSGNFVDPSRTSGFALLTNGVTTFPILFVPILHTDAAAHDFLSTFGASDERGIVRHNQEAGFRWVWLGDNPYVQFPDDTIVVQKNDWGYFIPRKLLPILPSDPQSLFPRFEGKYLIYDFVSMPGLPRQFGNGALTIGELIVRFADRRRIRIGDTKIKLDPEQKDMVKGLLKFSRILVNEVDTVFRGLKRNEETGDLIIETTVEVARGGKLWHYIEQQRVRTTLAGFFYEPDNAMLAALLCDELDPNIKRSAHALVRSGFKDIENRIAKKQHQRQLKKEPQSESEPKSNLKSEPKSKKPLDKLKTPPKDLKKAADKAEDFFEDTFSKIRGKSTKRKSPNNPILESDEDEFFEDDTAVDDTVDESQEELTEKTFEKSIEDIFAELDETTEENEEIKSEETEIEETENDTITPQPQPQQSTQPQSPGEMAGSFFGSASQFLSSTWDKSISTALQATADQLEVELVRKIENLLHENIERGIVDVALSVRPDGTTLGAAQITGGETISNLLSATQIKVSTDAALRGYIRFNAREHKGFKISVIEIPVEKIPKIEKILGVETLSDSLRGTNLCVYFAIRNDFLCFTAGSDTRLLDDLLTRIDRMHPDAPLPGTTLTFSPYLCGRLFEPFLDEMQNESTQRTLSDFLNSHPDSRLLYQAAYAPGRYYSTLVLPPVIVKMLSEFGKTQFPMLIKGVKKMGAI